MNKRLLIGLALTFAVGCQPIIYAAQETFVSHKKQQKQEEEKPRLKEVLFAYGVLAGVAGLMLASQSKNPYVSKPVNMLAKAAGVVFLAYVAVAFPLFMIGMAYDSYVPSQDEQKAKKKKQVTA
ncbi:MAG TPA: hypothetical protein VLG71_03580 [Candidatus Limnocylindria bacterium]|nr:hypothetical protein [Candidatus Limnocylindria bacterium]